MQLSKKGNLIFLIPFDWHSILNTNKNHIITSAIDHPAILNDLQLLRKRKIENDSIDVDKNGIVLTENVKKKINISTGVISIMLANNEIGTVQPIRAISNIAKKKSILMHTDAVQCFGKIKINVDPNCSFCSKYN